MGLFSQIIILLVLIIIIAVLFMTARKLWDDKTKHEEEDENKTIVVNNNTKESNDTISMGNDMDSSDTIGLAFYRIKVFNPDGTVFKSQDITEIRESGYIIGRSSDCDLVIDYSLHVGRKHAMLRYDERKNLYYIDDLQSKSGLYNAEGKKMKRLVVEAGMVFYLADVKCIFEAINPEDRTEGTVEFEKGSDKATAESPKEDCHIGNIYF